MCAMNVGIVMPNLAALRAALFTLSGKNLRGGGADNRPPSVRGLMKLYCGGNLQFFKEANISGQMLLTGGGGGATLLTAGAFPPPVNMLK